MQPPLDLQPQRPATAPGSEVDSVDAAADCAAGTQPMTAGGVRPLIAFEVGDMMPLCIRKQC